MKKNDWKKIGFVTDKFNDSDSKLLTYQLDVALDRLIQLEYEGTKHTILIIPLICKLFENGIYTNFHNVYENFKIFLQIKKVEINKMLSVGFTPMDHDDIGIINLYIDFFHKDELTTI